MPMKAFMKSKMARLGIHMSVDSCDLTVSSGGQWLIPMKSALERVDDKLVVRQRYVEYEKGILCINWRHDMGAGITPMFVCYKNDLFGNITSASLMERDASKAEEFIRVMNSGFTLPYPDLTRVTLGIAMKECRASLELSRAPVDEDGLWILWLAHAHLVHETERILISNEGPVVLQAICSFSEYLYNV